MMNQDIPEYKEKYVYTINAENEIERKRKWLELLEKINERHSEKIPDPFNDNILNIPALTDATSSMKINVISSKVNLQNTLKNAIDNSNNEKYINVIFNSNPAYNNYDFNKSDFNNIKYVSLCNLTEENKSYSYSFAPILVKEFIDGKWIIKNIE